MYIDKDGGAQCVADNEDDEREILPYPGTKSKSGDMEILRILQIISQSADGTKRHYTVIRTAVQILFTTSENDVKSLIFVVMVICVTLTLEYYRFDQFVSWIKDGINPINYFTYFVTIMISTENCFISWIKLSFIVHKMEIYEINQNLTEYTGLPVTNPCEN